MRSSMVGLEHIYIYIPLILNFRMNINLNKSQHVLLDLAREKGFVRLEDMILIWTSPMFQVSNLQRFVLAGILKAADENGKFIYNDGDVEVVQ